MTQHKANSTKLMQVGINYPWIDYGWDFGAPPAGWDGGDTAAWRVKKRQQIVSDFRAFSDLGLFAVRWFLLADGLCYGFGEQAPQKINGRWMAHPLPAEHSFHPSLLDDFRFALQTCADLNLKLVPSLIDFHWCYPGVPVNGNPGVVKCGRAEIVRDATKREAFFNGVLEPLLDVSQPHADAIYAWELINEPEWVTQQPSLMRMRTDENRTIEQDEMLAFLKDGIGRINARNSFRSTVGFAHWDTLDAWDSPGLGCTLHQFHYYAPDERCIPQHWYSDEYPIFLGEFATTTHRGWPDLNRRDEEQPITERLECLAEKGYSAAFLWSARATDEATTWETQAQAKLTHFLNSFRSERI